jgi:hypothetical protein
MVFPPISLLFSESNNFKVHIFQILVFHEVNMGLKEYYNKILMIICKMTCVIQCILPSHCFRSVNLSNYEHQYVLKIVAP